MLLVKNVELLLACSDQILAVPLVRKRCHMHLVSDNGSKVVFVNKEIIKLGRDFCYRASNKLFICLKIAQTWICNPDVEGVFEKMQNQLPWGQNHSSGTVTSGAVRPNEYDLEFEHDLSVH